MRQTGLLAVVAVAVALTAGCGNDPGGSDLPTAAQAPTTAPAAQAPTTSPGPTAPASGTPAEQSAEVVTNDGARLRITLAVGGAPVDGQADRCATAPLAGRAQLPVTLTVRNLGDRAAPFPPVRLETIATDEARESTQVRAAAGECSPFPRIAHLGAGESAVFTGSTPAGAGRIEVRISETDFLLAVPRS